MAEDNDMDKILDSMLPIPSQVDQQSQNHKSGASIVQVGGVSASLSEGAELLINGVTLRIGRTHGGEEVGRPRALPALARPLALPAPPPAAASRHAAQKNQQARSPHRLPQPAAAPKAKAKAAAMTQGVTPPPPAIHPSNWPPKAKVPAPKAAAKATAAPKVGTTLK